MTDTQTAPALLPGADAPAADAPAAEETVTIVNQGRGDIVIRAGKDGTLKANSQNTLSVPKDLADRVRKHHKTVKNIKDIFPDSPDLKKLQDENAALKAKASALEKLLNGSDLDKAAAAKAFAQEKADAIADWTKQHDELVAQIAELNAKVEAAKADKTPADVAALQAKVADLTTRLQAFLEADKKDLPALQKEHADAVPPVA